MSILIIYATNYGSTESVAFKLKGKLYDSLTYNVISGDEINFSLYKTIIIGTPIRTGKIHPNLKKYLLKHEKELLEKELYLYCLGNMEDSLQNALKQIPESIKNKLIASKSLGGKIVKKEISGVDKKIIEMIESKFNMKLDNLNTISNESIDEFADIIIKNS